MGAFEYSGQSFVPPHVLTSSLGADIVEGDVFHASHAPSPGVSAALCKFAIVEKRAFMRECLARSLSSCSTIAVESFPSVGEALKSPKTSGVSLMILSVVRLSEGEARQELMALFQAMPHLPTIVLAHEEDVSGALEALGNGAKGYIPVSLGFEIAIEAMRFVNAGGTYIPAECLLAARRAPAAAARPDAAGAITNRELAVIQALRQGKPNKIIAFELNMCESTVKVHVRHLMKKLRAKNRTEVAMKAGDIIQAGRCGVEADCSVGQACATAAGIAAPSD
jgi:DNA-binding NarL/FixJ family response regulator